MKNKRVPFSFRHNILVYMFWDVPKKQVFEDKQVGKLLQYIAVIMMSYFGLSFSNYYYVFTKTPPKFEDLTITKGILTYVVSNSGHGGGVRIFVKDSEGNNWKFPRDNRSLGITIYKGKELKMECRYKSISVYWYEEPLLFFGYRRSVWQIETCNPILDVKYKEAAKKRENIQSRSIRFVNFWLIVLGLCFFSFSLNFSPARSMLKGYSKSNLDRKAS